PVEGWRKRLSKGEVGTIQSACRKAMQTAGYQIEPVGAWQFYGLCKWLSLPFAVLRAARANRNRLGSLPTYILRRLRA
ncbi:MAG: sulfotransferase, partial [Planctomycetota bacterium]|nr:sulfotransferase [Planctomycetota bacterium]